MRNAADGKAAFNLNHEAAQDGADISRRDCGGRVTDEATERRVSRGKELLFIPREKPQ